MVGLVVFYFLTKCTPLSNLSLKSILLKNAKGSDKTNFRSAQSL